MVIPSGTNSELRKFRHGKSMMWSTKVVDGRACGLHLRRSSSSWPDTQIYYALVECNPLTPLLRHALDLLYNLFIHRCAAVGKILTGTLSRCPSAVAELLVRNQPAASPEINLGTAVKFYCQCELQIFT